MRLTPLVAAVAVLVGPLAAWAQESPYVDNFSTLEKALESTKTSKKDIIVDFTSDS